MPSESLAKFLEQHIKELKDHRKVDCKQRLTKIVETMVCKDQKETFWRKGHSMGCDAIMQIQPFQEVVEEFNDAVYID